MGNEPNSSGPVISTGHQLSFWHPGILAKYLAADAFAKQIGGRVHHVWVNHDAVDSLNLDIPTRKGDQLAVRTLQLGPCDPNLPAWSQEAIDPGEAITELKKATSDWPCVNLDALLDVWASMKGYRLDHAYLDGQMWYLLGTLYQKMTGLQFSASMATDLWNFKEPREVLRRLLNDAMNCVRHYNDAAARHPEAGIRPMLVEPTRAELPLWALGREPRQRVFADLSDSQPILTLESGELLDWEVQLEMGNKEPTRWTLAPRALLLTAIMRTYFCDLFIHGTGGGIYDRVMEDWWQNWTGEPLAPMVVVSADLYLPFDGVPLADRADYDRAVWLTHHLPHNMDRFAPSSSLDDTLVRQKQAILMHMDDDRDARRRRAAFHELHKINAALTASHPLLRDQAKRQLDTASLGVANAKVAAKRDWCFALYPPDQIAALRDAIANQVRAALPPKE